MLTWGSSILHLRHDFGKGSEHAAHASHETLMGIARVGGAVVIRATPG